MVFPYGILFVAQPDRDRDRGSQAHQATSWRLEAAMRCEAERVAEEVLRTDEYAPIGSLQLRCRFARLTRRYRWT